MPTSKELRVALGASFTGFAEDSLQKLNDATSPSAVLQYAGILQGMYIAAGALGTLDRRLETAIVHSIAKISADKIRALGYAVEVAAPPPAKVH